MLFINWNVQKSHFCQVETRSGTSLDPGIGNTQTDSEQTERRELDIGSPPAKTGECHPRIEPSEWRRRWFTTEAEPLRAFGPIGSCMNIASMTRPTASTTPLPASRYVRTYVSYSIHFRLIRFNIKLSNNLLSPCRPVLRTRSSSNIIDHLG